VILEHPRKIRGVLTNGKNARNITGPVGSRTGGGIPILDTVQGRKMKIDGPFIELLERRTGGGVNRPKKMLRVGQVGR